MSKTDIYIEMPGNYKKDDLRVKKTYRALIDAMLKILQTRSFNQITVNDLCEEACISRAAFYIHFNDKYDLFKYCLTEIQQVIIDNIYNYADLELIVNDFVNNNKKLLQNVLKDTNNELSNIVQDIISLIVFNSLKRKVDDPSSPNHIVLHNFCIGGITTHLKWLIKNNFPPGVKMMDTYFYELIEIITDWDAAQE